MTKTRKFTSINALRHAVKSAQLRATYTGRDEHGVAQYREMDDDIVLPVVQYRGTVKVHGENAGVRYIDGGEDQPSYFQAQSRNRDLSVEDDNRGFAAFIQEALSGGDNILRSLFEATDASVVYGEWCGPGIQQGEAIQKVDSKRWVVFAIRKTDGSWASVEEIREFDAPEHGIWSVAREGIPVYEVEIDFNKDKIAACRDEVDRLTAEVEKQCPVGAHFGVEGTGEGIVWVPVDTETYDEHFWFKTKAKKHKERAHKKKDKTPIDPEVMASIEEFVAETANDVRLEKGIAALVESGIPEAELSRKHTGDFLKWVAQDILKEESDVIEASGLEWNRQLSGPVSRHARERFFQWLDEQVMG